MANAISPRDTVQSGTSAVPSRHAYLVKGGVKLVQGTMAAINDQGFLVPPEQGNACIGIVERDYDNTDGADGAVVAEVRSGVFRFANAAAPNALEAGHVGAPCIAYDNQTVGRFTGGDGCLAGVVISVDSSGVFVALRAGSFPMFEARMFPLDLIRYFKSAEYTGTGSMQNVMHDLGKNPSVVLIIPTDLTPATEGSYKAVEGTHTNMNVVVNVTAGKKYVVMAFA